MWVSWRTSVVLLAPSWRGGADSLPDEIRWRTAQLLVKNARMHRIDLDQSGGSGATRTESTGPTSPMWAKCFVGLRFLVHRSPPASPVSDHEAARCLDEQFRA